MKDILSDNPPPYGRPRTTRPAVASTVVGEKGAAEARGGGILTAAISCNLRVPCMQVFPPPFFRRSSTIHWSVSGPAGKGMTDDSSAWRQQCVRRRRTSKVVVEAKMVLAIDILLSSSSVIIGGCVFP
jgi:hypothetical protein